MTATLVFAALSILPASWWSNYGDPKLEALVNRALTYNLDLKAAAQKIAEARALAGETRSKLLPSINTTSGAQRLRGGFAQGVARIPRLDGQQQSGSFVSPFETPIYQNGFDAKWELDFWGANRSQFRAAKADVQSETERTADTAVAVSAEVARAYIELRGFEERIAITESNRNTQRELLELTRVRAEAGLATQADVERQASLLATTEAGLPPLEAERIARLNRLAVLVGDKGLVNEGLGPAALLKAPPVGAGVDSEVLKRRPDVRAAEARIAAAQARQKAARTDLYPKVVISGLMGRQSTAVSGFTLGGGNFFAAGPQLQLPIFSGGRIRANIAAHDARLEQARIQFEKEILEAFEETENALAGYRLQGEQRSKLIDASDSARRSLEYSRELNRAGLDDFLAVLDAQRQLLTLEDRLSQARTSELTQSVALFKALAGGW